MKKNSMDSSPLLNSPSSSSRSSPSPFLLPKQQQQQQQQNTSPLFPLPENQEISIPIPIPQSPSSLKDFLIFGGSPPSTPPPLLPVDPTSTWQHKPNLLHRSRTAPAISSIPTPHEDAEGPTSTSSSSSSIVSLSLILLSTYLILGILIYSSFPSHFTADPTHPVVDALYFCIVTMCTIGYGDITPSTPFAKIFSISFVLFGFGFLDILLSSMVSYVLDLQESLLLSSIKRPSSAKKHNYLVDVNKGRMRIRMKVGLALAVVFLCVGMGTGVLRFVEDLGWLDSFYLSVMSVTTVGYGDRAFKTMTGRLFASVWLLVSTLAVARAFLYLAEARIDKRHRKIAKWVLSRDMTISEFLAADIDQNGFVR